MPTNIFELKGILFVRYLQKIFNRRCTFFIMPRIKKSYINWQDSINDYMIYCTEKDLRPKTKKSYESTLMLFAKYIEEEFKIFSPISVETKHIRDYMKFTKEKGKYSYIANNSTINLNNPSQRKDFGKPVSMWTINNYLRNIKAYFTYLHQEGIIKTNPTKTLKQYKHTRKPKKEIKDVDFNNIIEKLDLTSFAEYRDYVILHLLFDTGMRIGETLMLKTDDVLIDKKAIFIGCDINKGRRDRYVFFSNKMQKILRRWMDYKERYFENEFIFVTTRNSNFSVTNFEKNLKKYCNRAGIEPITCHQIRNNFARRCLLSGMGIFELSKLLGHSSVTVTEQAYLDLTTEDIRKSYQHFSPLENMNE